MYEPTQLEINRGRLGRETDAEVRERLIAQHTAQAAYDAATRTKMEAEAKRWREEYEAEQQAARAQHQMEADARLKESARQAFLLMPAAQGEDFERLWPSIRDRLLTERLLNSPRLATRSVVDEALNLPEYRGGVPD